MSQSLLATVDCPDLTDSEEERGPEIRLTMKKMKKPQVVTILKINTDLNKKMKKPQVVTILKINTDLNKN